MSAVVNKQVTAIILSVLCLLVCAGRTDKVSSTVKKEREGRTSAYFNVSLTLGPKL